MKNVVKGEGKGREKGQGFSDNKQNFREFRFKARWKCFFKEKTSDIDREGMGGEIRKIKKVK